MNGSSQAKSWTLGTAKELRRRPGASGWFTIRLANRVGPNSLVLAEDIRRPMIQSIESASIEWDSRT
jgi:hypothetical protein